MPCVKVFVQDPRAFLEQLDIGELACPVFPERTAVLSDELSVRLNHEIFFVSSEKARRRFESRPLRYCGLLSDPVTEERFRPDRSSPSTRHGGRRYYFSSARTLETFMSDPDGYAEARRAMKRTERAQTAPSG